MKRDLSTTLQDMEQRLKTALEKLADIEAELNAAISRLEPIRKGVEDRINCSRRRLGIVRSHRLRGDCIRLL